MVIGSPIFNWVHGCLELMQCFPFSSSARHGSMTSSVQWDVGRHKCAAPETYLYREHAYPFLSSSSFLWLGWRCGPRSWSCHLVFWGSGWFSIAEQVIKRKSGSLMVLILIHQLALDYLPLHFIYVRKKNKFTLLSQCYFGFSASCSLILTKTLWIKVCAS